MVEFQRAGRGASEPAHPVRVSADRALQAADVTSPAAQDLVCEDRPQGVFGGGRIEADAVILALRRELREMLEIHRELSKLDDQRYRIEALEGEIRSRRQALRVSEASKGRLKARLRRGGRGEACAVAAPEGNDRIPDLTREKARLGKRVRVARRRIERLEGRLAKLRASRAVLPKGESGGVCERQERPRTGE